MMIQTAVRDFFKLKEPEYCTERHLREVLRWLSQAQDVTRNGGVSAWYRFDKGWGEPFIETTGYIISTYLVAAQAFESELLFERAKKMAEFVYSMRLPSGGFRTYPPSQVAESQPTIFNTGQDILGLMDFYFQTKDEKYLQCCVEAAEFLISCQEKNGSWIQNEYGRLARTYETRTAWALLKVWQATGDVKYKKAAVKNLDWALEQQDPDGWFGSAELPDPEPKYAYTHTIAYCIEGFWFAGKLLSSEKYMGAATLALEAMIKAMKPDSSFLLAGYYDKNWHSSARYACLTGTAQVAAMFLRVHLDSPRPEFEKAGVELLSFLKSVQKTTGSFNAHRGGLAGSWPIYGDIAQNQGYSRLAYPNWAAKFYADALILEMILGKEISREVLELIV